MAYVYQPRKKVRAEMENIYSRVISIIYEITKPEKPDISDHELPLLAGALDSLDFASFLMAIEDEFSIEILESDLDELRSIDQIVKFIHNKQL
jgi:acyl carrier protein